MKQESIKCRLLLGEQNESELYAWVELFQSRFWGSGGVGGEWRGGNNSRVGIRLPTEISWQEWGSEKNKQAS